MLYEVITDRCRGGHVAAAIHHVPVAGAIVDAPVVTAVIGADQVLVVGVIGRRVDPGLEGHAGGGLLRVVRRRCLGCVEIRWIPISSGSSTVRNNFV